MNISSVNNQLYGLPDARQSAVYAPNNPSSTDKSSAGDDEKAKQIQQQQEIQKLKDRDREVKAHEQAHLSAAGGLATGSAHFAYVTGPDGQRYATGGDVGIDVSEVPNDPEATLRKAETIRRAAMAPAQPSGQDYNVAGRAAAMANKAAKELMTQNDRPAATGQHLNITV